MTITVADLARFKAHTVMRGCRGEGGHFVVSEFPQLELGSIVSALTRHDNPTITYTWRARDYGDVAAVVDAMNAAGYELPT